MNPAMGRAHASTCPARNRAEPANIVLAAAIHVLWYLPILIPMATAPATATNAMAQVPAGRIIPNVLVLLRLVDVLVPVLLIVVLVALILTVHAGKLPAAVIRAGILLMRLEQTAGLPVSHATAREAA